MGWKIRKRVVGGPPVDSGVAFMEKAPDARWASDLCRIWVGGRWLADHGAGDRLLHPAGNWTGSSRAAVRPAPLP